MSNFHLKLSIHLCILLGLLVAVVEMLHEHSYHHIDEDKLGCEHKADKVQWGDELQIAETAPVIVAAVTQGILEGELGIRGNDGKKERLK